MHLLAENLSQITGPPFGGIADDIYVFRTSPVKPARNSVASDHANSRRTQLMLGSRRGSQIIPDPLASEG